MNVNVRSNTVSLVAVLVIAAVFGVLTWVSVNTEREAAQRGLSFGAASGKRRSVGGGRGSIVKNAPRGLLFPKIIGGSLENTFYQPRVAALSPSGELCIMDKWGKVFVYDSKGDLLRSWRMPYWRGAKGMPEAIDFLHDGTVIVADTHYARVLFFRPDGEPLPDRTFGSEGRGEGEFCYPSGLAVDEEAGRIYVSEYGWNDRIQVFSMDGSFVKSFGRRGTGPGEFNRVTALAFSKRARRLYAADSGNHRIQVFDMEGRYLYEIGSFGTGRGKLRYPYDVKLYSPAVRAGSKVEGNGSTGAEILLVCEYGNNRLQAFTISGKSLGVIGSPGEGKRQLASPWAVAVTNAGELIVTDTGNHRLQNFGPVDTLFPVP